MDDVGVGFRWPIVPDSAAPSMTRAPVIDLESSDDESVAEVSRCKRPRVECDGACLSRPLQQPAQSVSAAATPLFLNRLLHDGEVGGHVLSLQDVFEQHPSFDGCPPQEIVIANYMIDLAWLINECPCLVRVKRLTILQGDEGRGCEEGLCQRAKLGLDTHVHAPKLPIQWGTHHSKFLLLLYEDCLRVCIRTCNDIFPDAHSKSQAMYVQDFPVRSGLLDASSHNSSFVDAFGEDFRSYLCEYLQRCGGFDVSRLARYDFSSAACSLVASIPGYHKDAELTKWGHMRLRHLLSQHAVLSENWPGARKEEALICQFSSLGSLTPVWLLDEFRTTLSASSVTKPPAAEPSQAAKGLPLHLVVPSVSQVRDSDEGWIAGVSVPIRSANLKPWLDPHLRRWGPAAGSSAAAARSRAAMPHVKSYCRYTCQPGGGSPRLPWLCVGSHNLSRAAWGELQKGGKQLAIRSYELGVVVFPSRLAALERDPQRPRGHFWRRRAGGVEPGAVLVPVAAGCTTGATFEVPVVCPTAVPPAGPHDPSDPPWAVDRGDLHRFGIDRFGSHCGERACSFYGRQAASKLS